MHSCCESAAASAGHQPARDMSSGSHSGSSRGLLPLAKSTWRSASRKGAKKLYGVKRENPNKSKNKGGRPRKVQAVDRVAQLEEQVDSLEELRARKAQLEEELIRTRRAHERAGDRW